jgi:hypothetical protein
MVRRQGRMYRSKEARIRKAPGHASKRCYWNADTVFTAGIKVAHRPAERNTPTERGTLLREKSQPVQEPDVTCVGPKVIAFGLDLEKS